MYQPLCHSFIILRRKARGDHVYSPTFFYTQKQYDDHTAYLRVRHATDNKQGVFPDTALYG